MNRTTVLIIAAVLLLVASAFLLRKKPAAPSPASQSAPLPAASSGKSSPSSPAAPAPGPRTSSPAAGGLPGRAPSGPSLLFRAATLPPLTSQQISAFLEQQERSAESLVAAYRESTNSAYLLEAATNHPGDADVQYTIVTSGLFPEARREWLDRYKASSPDSALPLYLSALEHYRAGDSGKAAEELRLATSKNQFGADFASVLQGLEDLHVSAGRSPDEALILAFQKSAFVPHLEPLRELSRSMQDAADALSGQADEAAAQELLSAGFVLGGHLSAGTASQTVLNQLVGLSIEKKFLQQLRPPDNKDPMGRPLPDVQAAIEQQRTTLRGYMQNFSSALMSLDGAELADYMQRVKTHGEASAMSWLQSRPR